MWRGGTNGALDCNGQCHAGEIRAGLSDRNGLNSWGGLPRESGTDTKRCNRGGKAFCCEAGIFDEVVRDCHWRKGSVFIMEF
jgi:chitinase